MPQPTQFSFNNYSASADGLTLSFNYTTSFADGSTEQFCETLVLPLPLTDGLDATLQALHLALGISYYKLNLAPSLKVPYQLDEAQASFWNTVYQQGLGEFLYVNKLPASRVAKFEGASGTATVPANGKLSNQAILGIGGGKDSALAGEVLKALGVSLKGFALGTKDNFGQAERISSVMAVDFLGVQRTISPRLLELNGSEGTYNGHVPISAIFALVGSLLAQLNGSAYVVVANEASSSLPSAHDANGDVNHQWSKSLAFERLFQDYAQKYLNPGLCYFSAIRPLTSVAVAKIFSKLPQYFEVFTSDNFVFRIDGANRPSSRWGQESPKSLSSFILLTPWLSEDDMLRIFGQNFLNVAQLQELYLSLLGVGNRQPPLDCVGTVSELCLSVALIKLQQKFADAVLLEPSEADMFLPKDAPTELAQALALQPDQAFPSQLSKQLLDFYTTQLRQL